MVESILTVSSLFLNPPSSWGVFPLTYDWAQPNFIPRLKLARFVLEYGINVSTIKFGGLRESIKAGTEGMLRNPHQCESRSDPWTALVVGRFTFQRDNPLKFNLPDTSAFCFWFISSPMNHKRKKPRTHGVYTVYIDKVSV